MPVEQKVLIHEHDEDPEHYWLDIELMNDCTLRLSAPKTKTKDNWPTVFLECGNDMFDTYDMTAADLREWVEVALGRRDHLRRWDCANCGRQHDIAPMLPDEIWQQIANPGERLLCVDCMQLRAQQRLGRRLTLPKR
jgi:hypothetical protein